MHRIFLGLSVWGAFFLIAECAMGISHHWTDQFRSYHFLLGIFMAFFLCLIHTSVMFHFIGSGKEMKEALELIGKDQEVLSTIRMFKARVFPFAFFAMLVTMAAAILGGGADTRKIPGWLHSGPAVVAVALNLWAFLIEYRFLKKNLELINILDRRLQAQNEQSKAADE